MRTRFIDLLIEDLGDDYKKLIDYLEDLEAHKKLSIYLANVNGFDSVAGALSCKPVADNSSLKSFITENEGSAMLAMKHKLYDEALILARGNVSKAARMLGVSRSVLNNYANKWEGKR